MDMNFSQADLDFRDEVRTFLRDELTDKMTHGLARTPGVFVEPDIGLEWHHKLHKKGWISYTWPLEHGGVDWTPMQRYIYEKEIALAGAPSPSPISLRLIGPVICEYGTADQKARFLERIRSAEDYWAQGYSEPASGSDLASLSTKAEQVGDEYVINGSKIWTTHAQHANWIFCLVRTDNSGRKQEGITFLLVPMDQAGITVAPILSMSGDQEVNQVFFDNAKTGVENRIGDEGQGWEIAKFLLQNERGGSCFAPSMLAHLDKIEAHAKELSDENDNEMAHDSSFKSRLAKLRLRTLALEFTELRILAEVANGRPPGPQTSLTKLVSSNLRQDIQALHSELYAYEGLQLPYHRPLYEPNAPDPIGGLPEAQSALAKYLNGRASTIYGGSDEVQKNIIAKRILGM